MAEVTVDPENTNPKELYGQGVRAYVLQDYESAVRALGKASEILSKEHDDDLHDSLGDVYLYYGKSLLELSRRDDGPLGEAVLKNVEEEESDEEVEEAEAEAEAANGKTDEETNEESSANKEEGKGDVAPEESDKVQDDEPSTSSGVKEGEEAPEEDLSDLQVAWEVLELAKKIFTNRGEDGKKNLADTLIVLGEISLESGNFAAAIDDMTEGLELQKKIFGNDSRTIAETFYKLGGALSTNGQIDEAIESFQTSYEYLNNRLASLRSDTEKNADEIKEIEELTPEIQEKVDDMKNLKAEVAKKVIGPVAAAPIANGSGASSSAASSSKPVSNISHLVKRKRKSEDAEGGKDGDNPNPAKKPSP